MKNGPFSPEINAFSYLWGAIKLIKIWYSFPENGIQAKVFGNCCSTQINQIKSKSKGNYGNKLESTKSNKYKNICIK